MSDVAPPIDPELLAEVKRIADALESIEHGLEHALERWNIETGGT
jgi:hypothetical protein